MKLRRQEITIDAPLELCFEVVAGGGRRLEKRSDTEWVVEFVTAAGGREIRTVELLTLDQPYAIHYRWLEGPLPEVSETIRFTSVEADKTELTYSGKFSVGRGPIGWLIGRRRVRPQFERLVQEHLAQAKQLAEKRFARTKVHASHGQATKKGSYRGGTTSA